jgi:phosphocarrier protein HPr
MTGPTLQQKVLVTNPQGFHMRPAAAFAGLAKKFHSDVRVIKDDQRVDGKSVLELMCLAAMPGSELTIEVSGDDAPDALTALVEIVNAPPPPE